MTELDKLKEFAICSIDDLRDEAEIRMAETTSFSKSVTVIRAFNNNNHHNNCRALQSLKTKCALVAFTQEAMNNIANVVKRCSPSLMS